MCPLWPLHIVLLYVLCLAPLFLMAQSIPSASVSGHPKKLDVMFDADLSDKIAEGETKTIEFRVANLDDFKETSLLEVELTNSNPDIASIESPVKFPLSDYMKDFTPNTNWSGSFNLTARFLGYTKVAVKLWSRMNGDGEQMKQLVAESESPQLVSVTRKQRSVDKAFVYTVAILVSVAFINMGCTLDLGVVKSTLKKPVGPVIGFCCQYVFMPLCAFALSKLLLAGNAALQLGLFVTGCCPGGGASNMWTYVLGGNLHLSITMTVISTMAAFAMMPLWTMTMGRLIFAEGHIIVPYYKIATLATGLVVPLMVGILIRRFLPKVAAVLVKALKPISGIILLVIIGFGVYANLYMFQLMDWRVLVSGMGLAWCGYAFGGVISLVFRQTWQDALAVSVETGVQNTGIAIFILRVTLDQPAADINTVVPVAVALMTPVPPIVLWLLQKFVLNKLGYCMPTEKQAKMHCPIADPELPEAYAEKLLPNNNPESTPVVVTTLVDH